MQRIKNKYIILKCQYQYQGNLHDNDAVTAGFAAAHQKLTTITFGTDPNHALPDKPGAIL